MTGAHALLLSHLSPAVDAANAVLQSIRSGYSVRLLRQRRMRLKLMFPQTRFVGRLRANDRQTVRIVLSSRTRRCGTRQAIRGGPNDRT